MSRFQVIRSLIEWISPFVSLARNSRQRLRRATCSRQVSVGSAYASAADLFQPSRLETSSSPAAVSAGSVNLANWAGIDAVNQDVATMAGFLMLSVPLLALMVMRGTMSVANNLGSMLAPIQAGSDAAALERTTGNYAYGDVSYGNLNAENRQVSQWNQAPNLLAGAGHSGFREADGRMFNEYGSGHSVIDTNAAISQLPFKPTMTRGYATDLRSQGQWYLNEADKIENGTSSSWTSSKGQFGSAVTATSDVLGARRESGSRASDTHNVGGNVVVEEAKGSSTREVTNNDLILREGNSRSSSDFSSRTFGSGLSLTGTGTVGTPLESEVGSGVSASLSGSLSGRRESGDNASAGSERSATNQTTRGTDKSDETSDRMVVSGSSGDIQSSGTYSQSSDYTDHSRSHTSTDGNDWRVAEAEERRAAAARYREIGSRMMSEASYAESHGFQISSDMSNLIQDRYEALQREHPEWHLPDLSNPRLDYRDVTRRDQAITYIMDDLMGDLRAHRINELSDVAGIAGNGSLGTNTDLGMPQTPALPSAPRAEGLVPSPLEGGTLLAVPDGPVDGAALARDLGIKVKPGARLGHMDGDLVPAMGAVAEEARSLGLPTPVVTSGNDSSQHMAGSAHYDDRALDFRGNNISDEQGERWASQVRSRLGDGYAVQFERFPDKPERDHLHVAKRRT